MLATIPKGFWTGVGAGNHTINGIETVEHPTQLEANPIGGYSAKIEVYTRAYIYVFLFFCFPHG